MRESMHQPGFRRRQVSLSLVVSLFFLLLPFISITGNSEGDDQDLAAFLAASGQYQKALDLFRQRLEETPEDPLLNYYVGVINLFLRNEGDADRFLSRAVELRAPFPEAYYWYAHSLLSRDKRLKASSILDEGVTRYPQNKKLLKLIREVRRSLKNGD